MKSTRPLKGEGKSTQPSLPLEWSRAKPGAFQIRHCRCFDSKAVSVDYSTGTGCCPRHPRGTSSSPALGAGAGDSSVSQTSPTCMQAALAAIFFWFFTPSLERDFKSPGWDVAVPPQSSQRDKNWPCAVPDSATGSAPWCQGGQRRRGGSREG